jgi:hypothetical protein
MTDEEIWKPVPSRPEIMASSHGRILLPPRVARMPNGGERRYETKPTLGTVSRSKRGAKHCYRNIFNRTYGNMKVHQLVCEAFHGPKPTPAHEVLHGDENGLNNHADNLSWGTRKENLNAPGFIAYCNGRTGENSPTHKGRLRRERG